MEEPTEQEAPPPLSKIKEFESRFFKTDLNREAAIRDLVLTAHIREATEPEDGQDIIADLNDLMGVLESSGDMDRNMSAEDYLANKERLEMRRHELLAYSFMMANDMEYTGTDINPIPVVVERLRELGKSHIVDAIQARMDTPEWRSKAYTPDAVWVDEECKNIRIIDFAVSVNFNLTFENKWSKYSKYVDLFMPLNTTFHAVVLNPKDGRLTIRNTGQDVLWNEQLDQDVLDLAARTEVVKERLRRSMTPSEMQRVEQLESEGRRIQYDTDPRFVTSHITMNEFKEFIGKKITRMKLIDEINKKCPGYMNHLLRSTSAFANLSGLTDLDDVFGKPLNAGEAYKLEEEAANKAATNYDSDPAYPSPPSKDSLLSAIEEMESRAKQSYEELERPKLLFQVPFNYSHWEGDDTKYARYRRMAVALSSDVKHRQDPVLDFLRHVFAAGMLKEDEFNKFMSREGYIDSSGKFVSGQMSYKNSAMTKSGSLQADLVHTIQNMTDKQMELSNTASVALKNGEVLAIRPLNHPGYTIIKNNCGVGKYTENACLTETKVQSLPFWDKVKRTRIIQELDSTINEWAKNLNTAGRDLRKKKQAKGVDLNESTSSTESDTSTVKTQSEEVLYGLEVQMRQLETLYTNLSYVGQKGSSGIRIVTGTSPDTFIITLPSESINKGNTEMPYFVVSLVKKGGIHNNFGDLNEVHYDLGNFELYVTLGRRLSRARAVGYMTASKMYKVGLEVLNSLRDDSNLKTIKVKESLKWALFAFNININTTSILDNVRYLIETSGSDYSFTDEFIKDKMMVPTKNSIQVLLYEESVRVLMEMHEAYLNVKLQVATEDMEGSVHTDYSRIIMGAFPSLMSKEAKYNQIQSTLMEVYTLYFMIPKALHGEYHNRFQIHKTPIELELKQRELGNFCPMSIGASQPERLEFDPYLIGHIMKLANHANTKTTQAIRDSIKLVEKVDKSILTIPTMTSTRSALVRKMGLGDMRTNKSGLITSLLTGHTSKYVDVAVEELCKCESEALLRSPLERKKMWKRVLETIGSKIRNVAMSQKVVSILDTYLNLSKKTGLVIPKFVARKDIVAGELASIIHKHGGNPHRESLFESKPVLSNVLEDFLMVNGDVEDKSVDDINMDNLKSNENWKVAIRPKGQRTQQDREIYVLNLEAKAGLYALEHPMKQVCIGLVEERISEAGDDKIITLANQVKDGTRFLARRDRLALEAHEVPKNSILHFNLDMTKWSAMDNTIKFMFAVCGISHFRIEEKLYMLTVLFRLLEKELVVDSGLIVTSEKNTTKGAESARGVDCIIRKFTNNYKSNIGNIRLNWLQGQLNYLSSYVHAAGMIMLDGILKRKYPGKLRSHINTHSDDNQMSFYLSGDDNMDVLMRSVWLPLVGITKGICIDISRKKSSISRIVKQFISQYNIAGEQVYMWTKSIISSISGCPYTTLKDDCAAVLAKVSDALSKGAPASCAEAVVREMGRHLKFVYGMDKGGKNVFSEILGIPEEFLPMCLGGMHMDDKSLLALMGPRSYDKVKILELAGLAGGTETQEPTKFALRNLRKSDPIRHRALSLYKLLMVLEQNNTGSEVVDPDDITLNPFRCSRFKAIGRWGSNPFGLSQEVLRATADVFKTESPGLSLVKPNNIKDLVKYYMILYTNRSFLDSMANQSPTILMLHKIQSRKKGVFRIYAEGDMHDQSDWKNLNATELGTALLRGLEIINQDLEVSDLYSGLIKPDPELRVLWKVKRNSIPVNRLKKTNPTPLRKPNFQDYSLTVNPVPKLLTWLFDESFAERNGITMPYRKSLPGDFLELIREHPREMSTLETLLKVHNLVASKASQIAIDNATGGDNGYLTMVRGQTYNNYKTLKSMLDNTSARAAASAKALLAVGLASKGLERTAVSDIVDSIKKGKLLKAMEGNEMIPKEAPLSHRDVMSEKDAQTAGDEYSEILNWSSSQGSKALAGRLQKVGRLYGKRSNKILFLINLTRVDIIGIASSMRSTVESSHNTALIYFVPVNMARDIMASAGSVPLERMLILQELIYTAANFTQVAKDLSMPMNHYKAFLQNLKCKSLTMDHVCENFHLFKRYLQTRALYPCCVHRPDKAVDFVSAVDSIRTYWVTGESETMLLGSQFGARVVSNGVYAIIVGHRRRITKMYIYKNPGTSLYEVTRVLKAFANDLYYAGTKGTKRIKLSDVLMADTSPTSKTIYLNTRNDTLEMSTFGTWKMPIRGMTIIDDKDAKNTGVVAGAIARSDYAGVDVGIGGINTTIRHKTWVYHTMTSVKLPDIEGSIWSFPAMLSNGVYHSLASGAKKTIPISSYINSTKKPWTITDLIGGLTEHIFKDLVVDLNTTISAGMASRARQGSRLSKMVSSLPWSTQVEEESVLHFIGESIDVEVDDIGNKIYAVNDNVELPAHFQELHRISKELEFRKLADAELQESRSVLGLDYVDLLLVLLDKLDDPKEVKEAEMKFTAISESTTIQRMEQQMLEEMGPEERLQQTLSSSTSERLTDLESKVRSGLLTLLLSMRIQDEQQFINAVKRTVMKGSRAGGSPKGGYDLFSRSLEVCSLSSGGSAMRLLTKMCPDIRQTTVEMSFHKFFKEAEHSIGPDTVLLLEFYNMIKAHYISTGHAKFTAEGFLSGKPTVNVRISKVESKLARTVRKNPILTACALVSHESKEALARNITNMPTDIGSEGTDTGTEAEDLPIPKDWMKGFGIRRSIKRRDLMASYARMLCEPSEAAVILPEDEEDFFLQNDSELDLNTFRDMFD